MIAARICKLLRLVAMVGFCSTSCLCITYRSAPISKRSCSQACILGDPISYNGLNACLVLNDVLSNDTFDNADDLESGLYDLFGYQSGSSSLCYTALGAVSEDYACLCATVGQGHDYDFWPETSTGCDDACAPNGDYLSYTSSAFVYPKDPIILSLPISSDVPQLSSPALKEATLDYSWSQPFTLCASAEAAFIGTSFQPLQASFKGVTLAATDQHHQPLCNGYNDAVSKSLCLCLDWDINQVPGKCKARLRMAALLCWVQSHKKESI